MNIDLSQIRHNYKNYFVEFVNNSDLTKSVKQKLTADTRLAKDDFYLYYPTLFSAYLPTIKEEDLKLLSIAGYLYYYSLIAFDKDYDLKKHVSKDAFFLIIACQEESIKILTSLLGHHSNFWSHWNKRKKEFLKAQDPRFLPQNLAEYENLADFKSAFGKTAIDALYCLLPAQDETLYQQLLLSHRYFSVGLQLIDDFKDLIEDLNNNQFNWAIFTLKNYLKEKEVNLHELPHQKIRKYFYGSGIAEHQLTQAQQYFEKALECLPDVSNSLWEQIILQFLNFSVQSKEIIRREVELAFV